MTFVAVARADACTSSVWRLSRSSIAAARHTITLAFAIGKTKHTPSSFHVSDCVQVARGMAGATIDRDVAER